jgi:hypothetical protein
MTMSETKREAAHGLDRVTCFQGENAIMSSPSMPAASSPHRPGTGKGEGPLCLEESNVASLTAFRAVPPHAVFEQIAAAASVAERLQERGRAVRFFLGAPGERPRVELHDAHGHVLDTLSATEAVELAAGMPLSV